MAHRLDSALGSCIDLFSRLAGDGDTLAGLPRIIGSQLHGSSELLQRRGCARKRFRLPLRATRQIFRSLRDFARADANGAARSEEHTSELQSLMRISYAVFCLKK